MNKMGWLMSLVIFGFSLPVAAEEQRPVAPKPSLIQERWGPDAYWQDGPKGPYVVLPQQDYMNVPVLRDDPLRQDMVRSTENAGHWTSVLGEILPAAFVAGFAGMAAAGGGAAQGMLRLVPQPR
jgi:hypothetical protein